MASEFDITIVGGGLAGMSAALDLSRKGFAVALVAPTAEFRDRRTSALMKQSVEYLDGLGVWSAVGDAAAPLAGMRLIDGTRRLLRAPCLSFHAGEIGERAFAYNVPNAPLLDALTKAVRSEPAISHFDTVATSFADGAEAAEMVLADGSVLTTRLAVAGDGRKSLLRQAAGIGTHSWRYPQSALVTTFKHTVPHENISTEFHTEDGPFTQVPLPGNRSSLVWVVRPREADELSGLPLDELSKRIERRMQSMLGAVEAEDEVQRFELSGLIARSYARGRVVLIGEAAHVFPPIGAQGLNLALRDVMTLSKVLDHASAAPGRIGSIAGAYDRRRRLDVASRTVAVDMLNRSLLGSFLPARLARTAGLAALSEITPLRNVFMREGMRPGDSVRAFRDDLRRRFDRTRQADPAN